NKKTNRNSGHTHARLYWFGYFARSSRFFLNKSQRNSHSDFLFAHKTHEDNSADRGDIPLCISIQQQTRFFGEGMPPKRMLAARILNKVSLGSAVSNDVISPLNNGISRHLVTESVILPEFVPFNN
ncbi:hypothetical protein QN372_21145, partial [Undibacterium sp. RTI2.1]|uniref:hypothetical protein n=1 Tax=unclassified Undibacterium TaxID=2630295 RepID=UPI002B22840E